MVDALALVCVAVHALQRERGCSVVVSLSDDSEFSDHLTQQFVRVDDELDHLQAALDSGELPGVVAAETHRALTSVRKHLQTFRAQIKTTQTDSDGLLKRFTEEIIAPLIALNVSLSALTGAPSGQVIAFQHFMQWKERMALERGYGMKSFFTQPEESQTLVLRALIRKQREFEQAFVAMADSEQLQQLRNRSSEVESVIGLTHSLLESSAGAAALVPLTAKGWFALLSRRIDEMHQIELRLIRHLRESTGTVEQDSDVYLPSRLEQHREILMTLPMLKNVKDSTKKDLLAHAKVESFGPGTPLSWVGERPEWMYIVLEGWVKICNCNEKGDEAILQMIGNGESVIDAPVFRDETCSAQAKVEQKALLLQIPAKAVRDKLSTDTVLLTNALQRLAERSQRQLQHIERLRLKSAQQRLGWFLLSLRLEADNSSYDTPPKSITLPYNKATIASYLDMTPETFSRILKDFRKKGLTVQRNHVTIQDPHFLCSYCDREDAIHCVRSKPNCLTGEEQPVQEFIIKGP